MVIFTGMRGRAGEVVYNWLGEPAFLLYLQWRWCLQSGLRVLV